MRNTAVVIALVGLVLAASYSSSVDEDEVQALKNELEEIRDDFPSERFEPTFQDDVDDAKQIDEGDLYDADYEEEWFEPTFQDDVDDAKQIDEDDLYDADYEEGEGMEKKYNQNDWDDLVETEMGSVFNNLGEKVSDPFRRRSRFSRRSGFRRRIFRRRRRRRSRRRRRRRRSRRRRYCIRLPGKCR